MDAANPPAVTSTFSSLAVGSARVGADESLSERFPTAGSARNIDFLSSVAGELRPYDGVRYPSLGCGSPGSGETESLLRRVSGVGGVRSNPRPWRRGGPAPDRGGENAQTRPPQ